MKASELKNTSISTPHSNRERNPNFKKEVFEKKVEQHIKCGYTKELAEWKVLGDFNGLFLKHLVLSLIKNKQTLKAIIYNGRYMVSAPTTNDLN